MNTSNMQAGAPAPKANNNKMIIIVVVVVVVLLCCCLIAAGAYAYSRYTASKVLSNINNQLATAEPGGSGTPGIPSGTVAGVPTGGLGNVTDRGTAWGYALLAITQKDPMSCTAPDAAKTTISVTQQPDASGAWTERWVVDCGGGKTIPVDISFTPAGGGINTVKATLGQ
jgi:hypothetical protein